MIGAPSNGRPRVDHVLLAGMLAIMVAVAFANILGRYVFHYSLAFTEEITINLFVGVVVIGSALAFERGLQLGVTVIAQHFPVRAQRALTWCNALLGAVLFAVVDILLVRECYFEITNFHARSAGLGVPVWIYYAAVVVLSVFVFRGLWRGARRGGEGAAGGGAE